MPIIDPNNQSLWDTEWNIGVLGHHNVRLHYVRAALIPFMRNRAKGLIDSLRLSNTSSVIIVGAGFGWASEAIKELLPSITLVSTDSSTLIQSKKDEVETSEYRAAIIAAGLDPDRGEGASILAQIDDEGPRARVDILNEDGLSVASRAAIQQAVGGKANWAVTDGGVLQWLTDIECQELSAAFHQIAINVAHVITPYMPEKAEIPEPEPLWNWKYATQEERDKAESVKQETRDLQWYTSEDWKTLLPDDSIIVTGSYKVF